MRWLTIFLLFSLLFYGCVEERQVSITGYEKIQSISGEDISGDGTAEIKTYEYSPESIDKELGIYMQKMVITYPVSFDVGITGYLPITDMDLSEIKQDVAEFQEKRKEGESACAAALNLDADECLDEESCLSSCSSQACENTKKYNEEALGREIYLFNHYGDELDRVADEINEIDSVATQEEKDVLAGKLSTMIALSGAIKSSLLFSDDGFGACAQPQYNISMIREGLSKIGDVEMSPAQYDYKVLIFIKDGKTEDVVELYIKDSPPALVSVEPFSLEVLGNGKTYEQEPLTVGWDKVEADFPGKFLYYSFSSETAPDESVMGKWKYPGVRERKLSAIKYFNEFYENPIGNFMFSFSAGVFSLFLFLGYYPAIGAAISVWLVLFFLAMLALETIYHIVKAGVDRRDSKEALLDAYGAPMSDWRIYAGVGFALVMLAVLANMFYTAPVESQAFEAENLMATIGSDFAGAIVILIFIIGVYTIFLVVEDVLKGLMTGSDYYALRGATKEENMEGLAELREHWQALKMRVEDLSKTGMKVRDEYAMIVSVPIERLEQMIASGKQGMAKQLIRFNRGRMETLEKRLDEKVEIMEEKWPEWEGELAHALSGNEKVPMNTLLFIPMQWREWAVEKYISEHRKKGYVLEGDVIIKREIEVDKILEKKLREMLKKKSVKQAILLSEDVEAYNSFPKGKKSVANVLFLKLQEHIRVLSKKMGASQVKRFMISGEKNAAVYLEYKNHQALVVSDRAKVKDVIGEWEDTIEDLE
ncbi:hypothetical protein GF415_02135 [Candidatus Micrarchaeota archaeon]|nr:hypothetical protein [Candidatus Micrarchaeota archaeon]